VQVVDPDKTVADRFAALTGRRSTGKATLRRF